VSYLKTIHIGKAIMVQPIVLKGIEWLVLIKDYHFLLQ